MGLRQVAGRQGVGRGVVSLIRLWKGVEKGEKQMGREWWVLSSLATGGPDVRGFYLLNSKCGGATFS
jgi:hypothetical protein